MVLLFENPSNLCYMITVIQSLLNIKPFVDRLGKKKGGGGVLFDLVKTYNETKNTVQTINLSNQQIEGLTSYDTNEQHDIHEYFLDLLESDNFDNPTRKLFRIALCDIIKCKECGLETVHRHTTNGLILSCTSSTLKQMLKDVFEEEEELDDYVCDGCGGYDKSARTVCITSLPQVLNMTLKRYLFVGGGIDIPLHFYINTCLYELSCICIRFGTHINHGHYITVVKQHDTGLWCSINDNTIREIKDIRTIIDDNKNAYMVYYTRS
jgi:ubiquitin C-terminal hydrolase